MVTGLLTVVLLGSTPVHELRLDPWTSLGVAGGAATAWVASETLFKHPLAPDSCRWCDRDASGVDTLNGLDAWGRGIRWDNLILADSLSNLDAFVVFPLAVGATHSLVAVGDGAGGRLWEDGLIVAEAVAVCAVVNQVTKFLVGRERPFVHALPEAERANTLKPDDNNLSFFSGHTSFAFSIAVAAGTVAELRGYSQRAWVWAIGAPLAVTVPLLRMMAERHYLSDVLVGAAIGAAFGAGMPLLLHGRREGAASPPPVTVVVGPGSLALSGRF